MTSNIAVSRHRLILAAILAGYLALGTIYSFATPAFEASDELHHYLYAKQIADGSGLPIQTPAGTNPAAQEASQPPLYYLLMAIPTSWIDTTPLDQTHKPNPHAMKGRPGAPDNKNMVIHSPGGDALGGAVLAVHVIRWLSLLLGAGTIVACYGIARKLIPARPAAALVVATFIASLPGYLFISASTNNDNAVILLGSLGLLLALDFLELKPSTRRLVLFGAIAGLAALSKLSGLAILPLGIVALAFGARRDGHVRDLPARIATIFIPCAVIAGWWYARNWLLYADPLGMNAMAVTAGARGEGFGLLDLLGEQEGLRWSFWGVFGGFNVIAERWVYWVYDLLGLAAIIGVVAGAVRHAIWRRNPIGAPQALALLWLGMLVAGLAKWSLLTMASQGRLLYPAIGAIATALVGGWSLLPGRRLRGLAPAAILLLLAALAAYLPFAAIAPAYQQPPLREANSIAPANPLMVSYGDKMLLTGYTIDRRAAQAGGRIVVNLQWRTLSRMEEDYSVFLHVYAADGSTAAQSDSYPGGGAYASSMLPPNVALDDRHTLSLPATTKPGRAQVAVGLYNLKTGQMPAAKDGQGRDLIGPVSLGSVDVVPIAQGLTAARPIRAGLANEIELAAASIPKEAIAGGVLAGSIWWNVASAPAQDYARFLHLVGTGGMAAQLDGQPAAGYRTSAWRPGDLVADSFELRLSRLEPGRYLLFAGMYQTASKERLPLDLSPLDRVLKRLRPAVDLDGPNAIEIGAIEIK